MVILIKLINIIINIGKIVLIIIMGSMSIFLFIAVLSRYLFDYSFYWIDAYSRYSLVLISFLGSAIAFRDKKHISVDVIINLLPSIVKKWIIKVDIFLIMVFSYVMLIQGVKLFNLTQRQIIPDLFKIRMSNITIVIPISAIIILLISLEMILSSKISSLSSMDQIQENIEDD